VTHRWWTSPSCRPFPSLFDEQRRHLRAGLSFLHDFAADLAKPIEKDGREHIEYVPTQIVTESGASA
jgi:hypothetical protein